MANKIPVNLNKCSIEFNHWDDWQQLKIDNVIIYEGHKLEPQDWIDFIWRAFGIDIHYHFLEESEE